MRYLTLAAERDPLATENAKRDILQYIRREPHKLFQSGKMSLLIRGGFSFERIETILESLVDEGVLRAANKDELFKGDARHGYVLADGGLNKLPAEDRSYGVV